MFTMVTVQEVLQHVHMPETTIIDDGSRSNVHGWADGYDWNHDGYDDVIGHCYCDDVAGQWGAWY